MQLIETAPHEFAAHFLFEKRGLEPFFACDRRVKDGGGSQNATFERDDETWEATLSYRDSGLKHPGRQLPSGTEFWLDEMREFELTIASDDDPVGEQSVYKTPFLRVAGVHPLRPSSIAARLTTRRENSGSRLKMGVKLLTSIGENSIL
ncbi:hypothetical protein [Halorubellus litoreus]|uniref:DUF7845 domain-containing protein n=1 Tax=Halorubellus litoreus TaxID=755308 RepID=A0ABD5VK48_9EURY